MHSKFHVFIDKEKCLLNLWLEATNEDLASVIYNKENNI